MIAETDLQCITLFADGNLEVFSYETENNVKCFDNVISFIVFNPYENSIIFMTDNRNLFYFFNNIEYQIQPMLDGIPDTITHYQIYFNNLLLIGNQTMYFYLIDKNDIILRDTINVETVNMIISNEHDIYFLRTNDNRLFCMGGCLQNMMNLVELIPDVDNPTEFISNILDVKKFFGYIFYYSRDMTIKYSLCQDIDNDGKSKILSLNNFDVSMFKGKKYEYIPLIKSIHNVIYYDDNEYTIYFITEDNCLWEISIENQLKFNMVASNIDHVYLILFIYYERNFYDICSDGYFLYFVSDINGNDKCISNHNDNITEHEWPFSQNITPTCNVLSELSEENPYKVRIIMDDNSVYGLVNDSLKFERVSHYDDKPLMPDYPLTKQYTLKSARTSYHNM